MKNSCKVKVFGRRISQTIFFFSTKLWTGELLKTVFYTIWSEYYRNKLEKKKKTKHQTMHLMMSTREKYTTPDN
jgi:hypothetical protein